jgi:hypothetical protein
LLPLVVDWAGKTVCAGLNSRTPATFRVRDLGDQLDNHSLDTFKAIYSPHPFPINNIRQISIIMAQQQNDDNVMRRYVQPP